MKNIALVAHDHMKNDLVEWIGYNWDILKNHNLTCTGTTGKLVEEAIAKRMHASKKGFNHLHIKKLKSGPLGGDQPMSLS